MTWMIPLALAMHLAMPPAFAADAPAPRPASPTAAYGAPEPADPADSLLRAASARMARADYRGAAELYRAAVRRFPSSMRLSEAMYYEAFALYRAGDLSQARSALDVLRDRYPQASARGDANTLRARICGELARQGDSDCAEEVTRVSSSASARAPARPSARGAASAGAGADCEDVNEDDARIAALNALLQMDADRAMPILTTVLARRDKCSERLRRKAVFLVAQKQSRQAADVLLVAARSDPDREVREQAVFWMSQVEDPRAVDMLVGIMNGDGDRVLRERAVFALSQHSSPAAAAALRTCAENDRESSSLRERAIFALGQREGSGQGDYLRGLFRRVSDPQLREKVLFALSQKSGDGNEAFILGVVKDPRESLEVRKKAIFHAGQMNIDAARLSALYGTLGERELREQVIFALSLRHDAASLNKLMDIARSDPDRELRKKAIFWLGQSNDPRATEFLTELINK